MKERKLICKHENRWHWGTAVVLISCRGVAMVELYFVDENPGVCHVSNLIVLEPLRRRGWASELLEKAEEEARKRGCFRIDLDAVLEPAFVAEFYERRGFVRTTQEEHTVRMYKMLKP